MEINKADGGSNAQARQTLMSLIDALKREVQIAFGEDKFPPLRVEESSITAARVRKVSKERRRRDKHFDPNLFGEPAWDMLLELFATELEQSRISVSSLCSVSGVPSTTALRWIETLRRAELVTRHEDPLDGRRTFIQLTEGASAAMRDYFNGLDEETVRKL